MLCGIITSDDIADFYLVVLYSMKTHTKTLGSKQSAGEG